MSARQPTLSQPRVLIPKQIRSGNAQGAIQQMGGRCMGTTWSVRLVEGGSPIPPNLAEQIGALLERIENQMSHFREHSDLCRFAHLAAGKWQALPAEFARVLRGALEVAHLSQGAFDPTLATQIDAWGFGAGKHFSDAGFIAPQAQPRQAGTPDWARLTLDAQNRLQQPGGIALNFSAIAKGFAVDALSGFLSQSGWKHHLVEIGGELRGEGMKPDGQPWWVALELPAANCPLPVTRIALHGLSVATSGDYRRSYRLNNRLIHHTLDPRTGLPLGNDLSSVTVIHRECMYADAWATALMVLGPKQGLALAENLQLCALLQGHDAQGNWQEVASTAWQDMLQ